MRSKRSKVSDRSMIEASRRLTEDALLDRTLFSITPQAYAEFLERLEVPPAPIKERLRKTMRTKAPWDPA